MSNFELQHLIYLLLVAILVGSGWWGLRGDARKEMKNALIWGIILAVLLVGWALFH